MNILQAKQNVATKPQPGFCKEDTNPNLKVSVSKIISSTRREETAALQVHYRKIFAIKKNGHVNAIFNLAAVSCNTFLICFLFT